MNAFVQSRGKRWRRLFKFVGVSFVALSVLSMMTSVAVPGMGWLLGGFFLIMTSVLSPLIGRRYVDISLGIYAVHLFTFGPLSDARSFGDTPTILMLILVGAPIAVALVPILTPIWRRMRRRREE